MNWAGSLEIACPPAATPVPVALAGPIPPGEACRLFLVDDVELAAPHADDATLEIFFTGYDRQPNEVIHTFGLTTHIHDTPSGAFASPLRGIDLPEASFWASADTLETTDHRREPLYRRLRHLEAPYPQGHS